MTDPMNFYANLVYFLKQNLSASYDVILFDTTRADCPVVAMSAKNRDNEQTARQFVKSALKNDAARAKGMLNNRDIQPEFGKLCRISVLFIRDGGEAIIGALCILMDCNPYLKMQVILSSVLQFDSEDDGAASEALGALEVPVAALCPEEPSLDMIDRLAAEMGMDPARFTQDEKMEFICDLMDMGVFRLKGAVAKTAAILQMSEQSIYRYIGKIKKLRNER